MKALAALYNASRPLGMGFLQYDLTSMTEKEAQELLNQYTYFDYLKGRVMKVDLSTDELETWGYDRDNGKGAAQRAIDAMLSENDEVLTGMHVIGKVEAASSAREGMKEPSVAIEGENSVEFRVGLADVADELGPAIDRATE